MAWPVEIEANKILLREGEDSQSMYLLQSGQLVVLKTDGDREIILGHIHAGELVGEMSFLDQKPRSATVRSVTDCKLIQIPQRTIDEVLKTQPAWVTAFIKTLVGRIRAVDSRIKV